MKVSAYVEGHFTSEQRTAFLQGNSADTKLSPRHRHQLPVETHGGVIDEIPMFWPPIR